MASPVRGRVVSTEGRLPGPETHFPGAHGLAHVGTVGPGGTRGSSARGLKLQVCSPVAVGHVRQCQRQPPRSQEQPPEQGGYRSPGRVQAWPAPRGGHTERARGTVRLPRARTPARHMGQGGVSQEGGSAPGWRPRSTGSQPGCEALMQNPPDTRQRRLASSTGSPSPTTFPARPPPTPRRQKKGNVLIRKESPKPNIYRTF